MTVERDEGIASRRSVLQWMAVAPGTAAALLAVACSGDSNNGTPPVEDVGTPPDTALPPSDTAVADVAAVDAAVDAGTPDVGSPADTAVPAPDANAYGNAPTPDAGTTPVDPPENCEATPPDVEGPFYAQGAPFTTELATKDEPGERILISGTVYAKDCTTPLKDVVVDVWQADTTGNYHDAGTAYRLRGQMTTNADGYYAFQSILPGPYDVGGALRPAHIHFKFHYPGQGLTTQLYFEGDPYLSPNDPCGGCSSDEASLIIPLTSSALDGIDYMVGTFDVVLKAS